MSSDDLKVVLKQLGEISRYVSDLSERLSALQDRITLVEGQQVSVDTKPCQLTF